MQDARYSKIDGVDLTDRAAIGPYLFGESILFSKRDVKYNYYQNGQLSEIKRKAAIYDEKEFFDDTAKVIVELGSGGGSGLMSYARKYPYKLFIGIERGLGSEVERKHDDMQNFILKQGNWEETGLEGASVDRIISSNGALFYGGRKAALEINRIAKVGAILRGNLGDKDFNPNEDDRIHLPSYLSQLGWEVYVCNEEEGGILVAKKVK